MLGTRYERLSLDSRHTDPVDASERELTDLVVCSLEPWDEVWRRNQFFMDFLLRRNQSLRVLYVEPPADPLFDLASHRRPEMPRVRQVGPGRRVRALRPLKPLPRRAGDLADEALRRQVLLAGRRMGLAHPVLWLNDLTYAPLIRSTGWPTLYDVTDDWLLAPFTPREIDRLRRLEGLALETANEVVVCSPGLAASRGAARTVALIPNGVDTEHFRTPRPRPPDFPARRPVAVYVGTLHESRLDVELLADLAGDCPELEIVLVGPDSLETTSRRRLRAYANLHLIGPRPYVDVPGYLQHADVVIVPHLVTPFTESLDPIKAYECLTSDTPTVATPVAGFREHPAELRVVEPAEFVATVRATLSEPIPTPRTTFPPSWDDRAAEFERALWRARG
jgi:glycosyltransferase involved in cell wall biosynthesis